MSNQQLLELVEQAQEIISQIKEHSDFQELDYHPDLTIGDALQALEYLRWEL